MLRNLHWPRIHVARSTAAMVFGGTLLTGPSMVAVPNEERRLG